MSEVIRVSGMSCQHCVMRVSKALKELAGVEDVSVDLESGDVRISTGTPEPSRQEMEAAIRSAGYTVVE